MNTDTLRRTPLALSLAALALSSSLAGCYGGPVEGDGTGAAVDEITLQGPGPVEIDPCVFMAQKPDLAPHSFAVVNDNGVARLNVTIRNRGCAASPTVAYVFQLNLVGGSNTLGTWTPSSNNGTPVGVIPRNGTQSFTLLTGYSPAQLAGFGGTWHIVVDPANAISELSESNNVSDHANAP